MGVENFEEVRKSFEEFVRQLPPEQVRRILSGLTVDQILDALTPEQREELAKKLAH
jgi:hypothetical protein